MRSTSPFTMRTSRDLCSPLITYIHILYQTARCRAITSKEGPEPGWITMCLVVRKTTSEHQRTILTTLYLAGAKNTDSWHVRKGDLQCAFPQDDPMVPSSALPISTDGERLTCSDFSLNETFCLGSFEFIANYFSSLSVSPRRSDSGTAFISTTSSGTPSPWWAMIEDSTEEFHMASSGEGAPASSLPGAVAQGLRPIPSQAHHGWRTLRPLRP
jgi:hypothetical protein